MEQGSIDRLVDLIIEHGIIVYTPDSAVPTRIYVGIPQHQQPTTANDLPLGEEDDRPVGRIGRWW